MGATMMGGDHNTKKTMARAQESVWSTPRGSHMLPMEHGCIWSWLGFIFCVSICTAQLPFNPTGQPNDVVVTTSSSIYVSTNVSGSGRVYRLNGSLVQQEVLQFPSGIAVLRIALSSDQSKLIVWVSNGSCIAYNAGNLSKGSVGTFQNVQVAGNNNVALVSAPVSGGGNSFYVGSSNGTVILIGQYGLDGTAGSVSRTSGNLFSVTASTFTRNWYGGFVAGSYTYFVVFDVFPSPGPGVRVLRVCNNYNETSIAAMYELYLNCFVDGFDFMNARITGASLVSYPMSSGGPYEDRLVIGIFNTIDGSVTTLFSTWPMPGPVIKLTWTSGQNYVYAITSTSVVQVPIEQCSSFTDCLSCLANVNPLCGWCTVEQKCSRRSQCQNSTVSARWVQGSTSQCLSNTSVTPTTFTLERPTNITLTISSGLPSPLTGESFLCLMSTGNGVLISVPCSQVNQTTFTSNITGAISQLKAPKLVVNFSFASSFLNISFAMSSNSLTAYNCPLFPSCSSCLQTDGVCGWCNVEKRCTAVNSSCSNFISVTPAGGQTYSDVCPSLLNGSYLLPVAVNRPLVLNTKNLPPLAPGYLYYCRIQLSIIPTLLYVPANYINSTSISCLYTAAQISLPVGTTAMLANISLIWTNSGTVVYPIDPLGVIQVTLYSCSASSVTSCTSCLAVNIGTGYGCGWCGGTSRCVEPETCPSFTNQLLLNCPSPVLSSVTPSSGPFGGGTRLTITGTDLGVTVGDIANVTVGGVNCSVQPDGFKPGAQFMCVTGNYSYGGMPQTVPISVTMRSGSVATAQYTYVRPSISSVFPKSGPMAGGTNVTIEGMSLNVGNGLKGVLLNGAMCVILQSSLTQVNCTSSAQNVTGVGVVTVYIDNEVTINNAVTFEYTNNPNYALVSPVRIIPAGGIILTFNGTYLNVSQKALLVINGMTSPCNQTFTTLKCYAPPLGSNPIGSSLSPGVDYTIVMDGAPGPVGDPLKIAVVPNPNFTSINSADQKQIIGSVKSIIIIGANVLSVELAEISVTVGGEECVINRDLVTSTALSCSPPNLMAVNASYNVTVSAGLSLVYNVGFLQYISYGSGGSIERPFPISSVFPKSGPMAGGTNVTIEGMSLNVGNGVKRVLLNGAICVILQSSLTQVNCTSSAQNVTGVGVVTVYIDNEVTINNAVTFEYTNNPNYALVSPVRTIPAGGIILTFNGTYLNVSQKALLVINGMTSPCNQTFTTLKCYAPPLGSNPIGSSLSPGVDYTIVMDGAPGPVGDPLKIAVVPNPNFTSINSADQKQIIGSVKSIIIIGANVLSVELAEISVTVGGEECVINRDLVTSTALSCSPPNLMAVNASYNVTVSAGLSLVYNVGFLQYISYGSGGSIERPFPVAAVVGGAGGGGVLVVVVVVVVIVIISVVVYGRSSRRKNAQVASLLMQMESMESAMADECKRAFTELQTDLHDVASVQDKNYPFRDFQTFAMRFLFPSASDDHIVLKPVQFNKGLEEDPALRQLRTFKHLLLDKKFLLTMIRTLEAQEGSFALQDRCNFASMLMIALQHELPYATDILIALLSDLMRTSASKSHPKLLLRRTESVAEKLLGNWLCFLLFPFILEHAGEPLFILFRAIKSQLDKGPVDVITGEARNSLSEEKLLRQHLDADVVEGVVDTGTDNLIPIRLLASDTTTQAKEKILDALYKNCPTSNRPQLTGVDLELKRGNAGISLRDHDESNERDGEWIQINTLGHYKLDQMSKAYLDNPKNPQPRFSLLPRHQRPVSMTSFDTIGTIISNMSAQSSRISLMSDGPRVYHLVKPEAAQSGQEGEQRHGKIVSEVFLTRLLATKRIIQPYVDDLFNAVFCIPRGKPLPKPIKYLFDFLDLQAADMGITDPEVLHTWKTNSLPLRFWVNVIKNPDFVFDIHKSATVDSCLSVISQAYIDACSTSEAKYSKDTPSSKLLYVNEVRGYKTHIQQYYNTIQSLPKMEKMEMDEYLQEGTQANQQYFVSESALYELAKYGVMYSAEVVAALSEDGLTDTVQTFEEVVNGLNPEH
eukprot:Em0014g265a